MSVPLPDFLSHADRLLILCLHAGDRFEAAESALQSASGETLDTMVESAFRQHLNTLFYSRLKQARLFGLLTSDGQQRLRNAYQAYAAAVTVFDHDIRKPLQILEKEGIDVVALKGFHLAHSVYDNPAERLMCDIDLLVRRRDIVRAAETLIALGYGSANYRPIESMCDDHHHIVPLSNKRGDTIELHWALSLELPIDPESLWDRSVTEKLDNEQVRVLSPEDLVLHLCAHATTPRFEAKLKEIYDLHATILHYRERLNWTTLQTRSREWEKSVLLLLSMAADLFFTLAPPMMYTEDGQKKFADIKRKAFECMFSDYAGDAHQIHSLLQVLKTGDIRQSFGLLRKKILYPKETIAAMYGISPDSSVIKLYGLRLRQLLAAQYANFMTLIKSAISGNTALLQSDRNIDDITGWLKNK